VSPEGITTGSNEGHIQERLTLRTKLKSFLGLCTYYRQFISSFTDTAKLLTRFTKEEEASQWFPEVEDTF
jgi:hypothetical protein